MGEPVTTVARFGLSVELPAGWEASVYQRPAHDGETTRPVLHAASFPLPPARGDFGSGAVEGMGPDDVLVTLLEYSSESVGTALFARQGMPRRLGTAAFNPTALQRVIPGHAGTQAFFTEAGRAFCLYAVLGSWRRAILLVPRLNRVLATVRIEP